MFDFVKKCFFTGLAFVSTLTNSLSCISMNNQEFKVRIQIVNANNDGLLLFPFSIKTSKCSGSCNSVNDPPNYQLKDEFHKQIIRTFKRKKVYSSFTDNIWGDQITEQI